MQLFLGLVSWASNKGMQMSLVQNLQLPKLVEKGLYGKRLLQDLPRFFGCKHSHCQILLITRVWYCCIALGGFWLLFWEGLTSDPNFFVSITYNFITEFFQGFLYRPIYVFFICIIYFEFEYLLNKIEQAFLRGLKDSVTNIYK